MTPEAVELLRAGQAALRPTDVDRERVLQALWARVGTAPLDYGAGALGPRSHGAKVTLFKVSTVVLGLGVAGGSVFVASDPPALPTKAPVASARPTAPSRVAPPVTVAPPPAHPQEPAPSRAETPTSAPSSIESRVAPAPSPATVPTSAPPVADGLAEEVAILSRAGSALHAGRAAAALAALDEHQRRFPSGLLAQERSAARVQALCALGHRSDAEAELARLASTAPGSPHLLRARKACAASMARGAGRAVN